MAIITPAHLTSGEHKFLLTNGIELTYLVAGNANCTSRPIIVHSVGWGFGRDLYVTTYQPLEVDHLIIYLSPRGNDGSSIPAPTSDDPTKDTSMSARNMVHDLDLFRRGLGLETLDIIGHSSGGAIALGYAMYYPDRVGRLVLNCPDLIGCVRQDMSFVSDLNAELDKSGPLVDDESFKTAMVNALPIFLANPASRLGELMKRSITWTPSLWCRKAHHASNEADGWKQETELAKATATTLIVVGEQDRCCPWEVSSRIVNAVRGQVQILKVRNAGHFPHLEQPPIFWDAVLVFLQETSLVGSGQGVITVI
jgi:proline iminopeptidase